LWFSKDFLFSVFQFWLLFEQNSAFAWVNGQSHNIVATLGAEGLFPSATVVPVCATIHFIWSKIAAVFAFQECTPGDFTERIKRARLAV
jgi:hypothetical protein